MRYEHKKKLFVSVVQPLNDNIFGSVIIYVYITHFNTYLYPLLILLPKKQKLHQN